MDNPSVLIVICITFCIIPFLSADHGHDEVFKASVHDLLNTCMDGRFHKTVPGPEDSLHSQCAPWANRSCCTTGTSISVHYDKMYDFDWSHCSHVVPLSDKCRRHFREDLCFYECSPNVGPWLVKVDQKIRKQRFIEVPLCRSDCDAWYKDCIDDYTCTDNWGLNFNWKDGFNRCPLGSSCQKFSSIFQNSSYFCETVWDHSWKVVDDSEHCMRLWFDSESGNPNDAVAKWKAEEIIKYQIEQINKSSGVVGSKGISFLVPFFVIFYK